MSAESSTHRLQASNLVKSYKGRSVVRDVSFVVRSGQIVGLLGPNGAGKTTSFYMVAGLVKADGGSITLDDALMTSWPIHVRAQRGIAYLPQEPSVFRKLSVEDNILAVLENLDLSESQRIDRLHQILRDFRITHIAQQKAFTLSGGERRRVEVARAIALNPLFLLLDEPFAGIDPLAIADIQNMVQELKRKNIGVLITDHNVRETLAICDFGYLLSDGKIIEQGTPQQIAESPMARERYLGHKFKLE